MLYINIQYLKMIPFFALIVALATISTGSVAAYYAYNPPKLISESQTIIDGREKAASDMVSKILSNCSQTSITGMQKFIFSPNNMKVYDESQGLDAYNIITPAAYTPITEAELTNAPISAGMSGISKVSFTNLSADNKITCNGIHIYYLNDSNVVTGKLLQQNEVIIVDYKTNDFKLISTHGKLILPFGNICYVDEQALSSNMIYRITFDLSATTNTPFMINIYMHSGIIYSMLTCVSNVKLVMYFDDTTIPFPLCNNPVKTGPVVGNVLVNDYINTTSNIIINTSQTPVTLLENTIPNWYGIEFNSGSSIKIEIVHPNQNIIISDILFYTSPVSNTAIHPLSVVVNNPSKEGAYVLNATNPQLIIGDRLTGSNFNINVFALKFLVYTNSNSSLLKITLNSIKNPIQYATGTINLTFYVCVYHNILYLNLKRNPIVGDIIVKSNVTIPNPLDCIIRNIEYNSIELNTISDTIYTENAVNIMHEIEGWVPTWHGLPISQIKISADNKIFDVGSYAYISSEDTLGIKSLRNIFTPIENNSFIQGITPIGPSNSPTGVFGATGVNISGFNLLDFNKVSYLNNVDYQVHMLVLKIQGSANIKLEFVFKTGIVKTKYVYIEENWFNTSSDIYIKLTGNGTIIPNVKISNYAKTLYVTDVTTMTNYNEYDPTTVTIIDPQDANDPSNINRYTGLERSINTSDYNMIIPYDNIGAISITNIRGITVTNKNINIYYRDKNNLINKISTTRFVKNMQSSNVTSIGANLSYQVNNDILLFTAVDPMNIICIQLENTDSIPIEFSLHITQLKDPTQTYHLVLYATNTINIIIKNLPNLLNYVGTILTKPIGAVEDGYAVVKNDSIKWNATHFTPLTLQYNTSNINIDVNKNALTNVHHFAIYNLHTTHNLIIRNITIYYIRPGVSGLVSHELIPHVAVNVNTLVASSYPALLYPQEGVQFLLTTNTEKIAMTSFIIYAMVLSFDNNTTNDSIPTLMYIDQEFETIINNNIIPVSSLGKIGFYSGKNTVTIYFQ